MQSYLRALLRDWFGLKPRRYVTHYRGRSIV